MTKLFENLPRANSIMAHGLYGKAKYNDRIHQMNSNLFIFPFSHILKSIFNIFY